MNSFTFAKVVTANRLMSHNQGHKIRVEGIHGTLTSFWVENGKLFGVFSYKNSMATNPGLRLEMDRTHRVNLRLLKHVLDYFEDKGIS